MVCLRCDKVKTCPKCGSTSWCTLIGNDTKLECTKCRTVYTPLNRHAVGRELLFESLEHLKEIERLEGFKDCFGLITKINKFLGVKT